METDIGRKAEDKDEQCLQGQSEPGGDILGIIDSTNHHHATGTRQHGNDRILQWKSEEDTEVHPQTNCNSANQGDRTDMLFTFIR
ncbi:hypothetical protein RIMD111065_14200 [Aeromonas hydrophila]|nr:hypothetical protein RIMD111065_14200 [Aeromonas hydrophila]